MTCIRACILSMLIVLVAVFVVAWTVLVTTGVPIVPFQASCRTANEDYVMLEGRMTRQFIQAAIDVHKEAAADFAVIRHKDRETILHPLGVFGHAASGFETYSTMAWYWIKDQEQGREMGTSGWLRGPPVPCDDMRKVAIEPGSG